MRTCTYRHIIVLLLLATLTGCGTKSYTRSMEATAYCGCGDCCDWHRGSWKYLKLNIWDRYVSKGRRTGKPYTGETANLTFPQEPTPGLFSLDSLRKPWMIPVRIIFFPWLLLPADGTIAADTDHYPFGTRMHISGYGWGVVEDRGGAIKGPDRIDLYFDSHEDALKWGRQRLPVKIIR